MPTKLEDEIKKLVVNYGRLVLKGDYSETAVNKVTSQILKAFSTHLANLPSMQLEPKVTGIEAMLGSKLFEVDARNQLRATIKKEMGI